MKQTHWNKLGKIFDPTQIDIGKWMREFEQCPTPFLLNDDVIRVYFGTRLPGDTVNYYATYPAYVDLSKHNLSKVVGIAKEPLLPLGEIGAFDEFCIIPSSVVRAGDLVHLYYSGWTRMSSVPYTVNIGLAISRDGGTTFEKPAEGPVLGLTFHEPYLVKSPTVKIIEGDFHMWYSTGTKWILDDGKPKPVFQIAHAISRDGFEWERNGKLIVPALHEDECQDLFMPVWRDSKWHSVFGYCNPLDSRTDKTSKYQLGYAWSADMLTWHRDDANIGVFSGGSAWDSGMQDSSQLFELDGRYLMFYCGNHFGRDGFGIDDWLV